MKTERRPSYGRRGLPTPAERRQYEPGQSVQERHALESQYPLYGTIVRYDDPFAPVAQSDWEALQ